MTLLTTQNLNVRIANKIICQQLNLSIQAGEIWGILGRNGSGKTTLLHTLAGLLPAHEGEIFLQKKILNHLSRRELAQKMAVLFQSTQDIFPQTVWEFCSHGRYPHSDFFAWENTEDKRIILDALHAMELGSFLQRNVQTLSGGERKRLGLATVLAQTPALYVLDEPMNHLDLYYQSKTIQYFKQLAKENSVGILLSLHDVNLAWHFCEKFLLLFENGEIILGDKHNVFTTENLSRLYQHPLQVTYQGEKPFWLPCF